ncbi:MAG TPA: dihydrodipicolinate synthase family protein, partial [Thermoplasmata archaeon]|nr:dihydrodipicolinate synthase family protein [Thermoplasmata archaeon]
MALEGLCVPIPTLFDDAGALDAGKMTRFTRMLCDAKVDHVFALGTLGEFPLIDESERPVLLESVIESVSWHADAWVGCGAPSVRQAIRYAVGAAEAGAAVLVAVPPFFLKPSPEAILDYYRRIHAEVKLPLLAYNIPAHVGYALDPAWVHRLASEGVLAGIKDTSGSLESVRSFLSEAPAGFGVLPGDDLLALDALQSGAVGVIMGVANLVPKLCVELVRRARAGDIAGARPLQELVNRVVGVIAQGPFPAVD